MKNILLLVSLVAFLAPACGYAAEENNSIQPQKNLRQNIGQILMDETIPPKVKSAISGGVVRVTVSRPNVLMNMFVQSAEGSGFVVGDGEILTCFHNLAIDSGASYYIDEANSQIFINLSGKTYPAKVIGADPYRDLALLKVVVLPGGKFEGKPIFLSPLGLDKFPRKPWFVLGFWPGGSAFLKEYRHFEGYMINPELTGSSLVRGGFDEPTDQGLSGSPIVDGEGECRGIIERTSNSGTIFIPADEALEFLRFFKSKR